jgi:hypothetical protein
MANKVSSNGKDDIGSAYSDGQGAGQKGYGAHDAGGVHNRKDPFRIGRPYRDNQASGVRGAARGFKRPAWGGSDGGGDPTW